MLPHDLSERRRRRRATNGAEWEESPIERFQEEEECERRRCPFVVSSVVHSAVQQHALDSVTRSRDFARKWRFLEAARALKIGPRALREFFKTGAFWGFQNFYVVKIEYYFEKYFRQKFSKLNLP